MAEHSTSSKLAIILHADIADSTRLVQHNEHLAHKRIQDTFHNFEQKISQHYGHLQELRGDALLAVFDRASDAVAASVAFQTDQRDQFSAVDDEILPTVRVGIAIGEVIIADNTITGSGVVLAQRLEQLSKPGGIVIQGAAYETVPRRFPFVFKCLGPQTLKGFGDPVQAYSVELDAGLSTPPESEAGGAEARPAMEFSIKPSIAVLPFINLNGDPGQEYLPDGITDDIITELSKFPELSVIARNSAFAFKNLGTDTNQIARELGVNYILEGSIQRGGNRLRITAKLIETESGGHIWGEKYDRELKDIFELQDDLTMHVVGSIAPQVELAELQRSRKLSNTDFSAYELALQAQALTYDAVRVADPSMLDQAMSFADRALELDKRCTHALWTRGMGCVFQYLYGWSNDPGNALAFAIETAEHLIRIDPSNAKSYIVRAWAFQYRRDYDLALSDYRRALELNPNLALNLFTMAWSEAVAGLSTDARKHAQKALELSPRDTDIWLAWAYATLELASFIEHDFSETVKWGRLAIQLHARMPARQLVMIAGYGHLGDMVAAKSHVSAVTDFAPDILSNVLSGNYEVFKLPEHNSLLLEGLRKVGL